MPEGAEIRRGLHTSVSRQAFQLRSSYWCWSWAELALQAGRQVLISTTEARFTRPNVDKKFKLLMHRPLGVLDFLIIAVLVIIAAIVIVFLWKLIIAIIIIAVAYYIYRWYRGRG